MADLMNKNGDDYSKYEEWAKKLQGVYATQSKEIQDTILFFFTLIPYDFTLVNPPRPNASVIDEASHRISPKMSQIKR